MVAGEKGQDHELVGGAMDWLRRALEPPVDGRWRAVERYLGAGAAKGLGISRPRPRLLPVTRATRRERSKSLMLR